MRDIAMEISLTTIMSAIAGHLTDAFPVIISLIGGALSTKIIDTIMLAIVVAFLSELLLPFTGSIHQLQTFNVSTAFIAFALCAQLAFQVKKLILRSK